MGRLLQLRMRLSYKRLHKIIPQWSITWCNDISQDGPNCSTFQAGLRPAGRCRQVAGVWGATVDAVRSCGARASFL